MEAPDRGSKPLISTPTQPGENSLPRDSQLSGAR